MTKIGFVVSDECTSLPTDYDVSLLCSGVVDYDFYLPSSMSSGEKEFAVPFKIFLICLKLPLFFSFWIDGLNQIAISQLNDSTLTILPNQCLSDLKKLVCTSVYLECVDGGKYFG